MRKVNKAGVDLVKQFEGFRSDAYLCPAGVLTIGYGHTKGVVHGQKITKAEGEKLLQADLEEAGIAVERLITVPLNDNQFAALCSFTFNVGDGNLGASTLRRKLNQGDYAVVPSELGKWVKATVNGVKQTLQGLVRRRAAEGELWLQVEGAEEIGMPQSVESVEGGIGDNKVRSEVTARSGLRLRGGPGLEFDVLRTLPCGSVVYVGQQKADWVEVDLQGDGYADGWAFQSYLRAVS
jgi:lysozyme